MYTRKEKETVHKLKVPEAGIGSRFGEGIKQFIVVQLSRQKSKTFIMN